MADIPIDGMNAVNIHMLHIGKSGGTALKHALSSMSSPGNVIHLHKHSTKLCDVPRGEKVIFFLRNPIKRFISGFYSRQRKGRPRYNSQWSREEAVAFSRFSSPNQLANALSSTDETRRREAMSAMQCIEHVRDSYWKWLGSPEEVRDRADDILFIGLQESLDADCVVLGGLLNIQIELPSDAVSSHRNPAHLDYVLDPEAVENLADWYAPEYAAIDVCIETAKLKGLGGAICTLPPNNSLQARRP